MRNVFLMLVGILCLAMTAGTSFAAVVEDFSTNPTARGWVDASGRIAWIGGATQNVSGANLKRHEEGAYYLPLGQTYTQSDDLWATFDARVRTSSITSQRGSIGFFDAATWTTTSTSTSPSNRVTLLVSDHGLGGRMTATVSMSDSTEVSGAWAAAWAYELGADSGTWTSFSLTYTAGAGANNAGQAVLSAYAQGDLGGTLSWSKTADLAAGKTFSIDSFGMFTGLATGNSTDGLNIDMDNVAVIPEPTTLGLLALGAVGVVLRRKTRS